MEIRFGEASESLKRRIGSTGWKDQRGQNLGPLPQYLYPNIVVNKGVEGNGGVQIV